MKFKWTFVYYFLIVKLILIDCAVECGFKQSKLFPAVNEIYVKVFANHSINFAVVSAEKHLEINEISDGILQKISRYNTYMLRSTNFANYNVRLNSILLTDSVDHFKMIFDSQTRDKFDFKQHFLVILSNGSLKDSENIFKFFWTKKIINVKVLVEQCDSVLLTTFHPFGVQSCNNVTPIISNRFINNSFVTNIAKSFRFELKNLWNCSINGTTYDTPPMVTYKTSKDGRKILGGSDVKILEAIAKELNFSLQVEIIHEEKDKFGLVYENGTATGPIKMILDGETDVIFGYYLVRVDRLKLMESSIAYDHSQLVFVVPPGHRLTPTQKFLRHFIPGPVCIIFIIFVSLIFVCLFITNNLPVNIRIFMFGRDTRIPYLNVVSTILGVADKIISRRNFSRFMWMLFVLQCLFLR